MMEPGQREALFVVLVIFVGAFVALCILLPDQASEFFAFLAYDFRQRLGGVE